jgi:FkbM family methyltransferase
MRIPGSRTVARYTKALFARDPDRFFKSVTGIIHVGANTGQERDRYLDLGLAVLWIEPVPEIFQELKMNLAGYAGQSALQGLITDRDDTDYEFHVANNRGESSSIFDLGLHQELWPKVAYERAITLKSTTLTSLVRRKGVDLLKYQALILDTQGSELLVLRGADPILPSFRFIKLEVADFESYKGCCQLRDVEQHLAPRGFREFSRTRFEGSVGSYYDIVYERIV